MSIRIIKVKINDAADTVESVKSGYKKEFGVFEVFPNDSEKLNAKTAICPETFDKETLTEWIKKYKDAVADAEKALEYITENEPKFINELKELKDKQEAENV